MNSECLDFQRLPHQQALFLDFLAHAGATGKFYPSGGTPDLEVILSKADRLLNSHHPLLEEVCGSIESVHAKLPRDPEVGRNLDLLRSGKAVAVVTGQQAGLMGGPALAVYKAITTIQVAKSIEENGIPAVPVFWIASDDSDFREARQTFFLKADGALTEVSYPNTLGSKDQVVGGIQLSEINACLSTLEREKKNEKGFQQVMALLSDTYSNEATFGVAFAAWLARLFLGRGLLIFDPLEGGHKRRLTGFFEILVRDRTKIISSLQQRAEDLQSLGVTPQVRVKADETLLFWHEKGQRFKLSNKNGFFSSQSNSKLSFSTDEMLEVVRRRPEHLGPNALLRPLLQDRLFPCAVYVGGPAEIAYYAQVDAIGKFFDLEPLIVQRSSLTLVDPLVQDVLSEDSWSVETILESSPLSLFEKGMLARESDGLAGQLSALRTDVADQIDALVPRLAAVDASVAEMLERRREKILYQIDSVRGRFVKNQKMLHPALTGRIDLLYNCLKPRKTLQERVLNFNEFLFKAGLDLVDRLMDELRPFERGHQVLYL